MQRPIADLRARLRLCPFPGPRVVGSFVDIALKLIKRLRGNTGNTVLIGLAVEIEVVPHVRACSPSTGKSLLARKPCQPSTTAFRLPPRHGSAATIAAIPSRQNQSELVEIHIHALNFAARPSATVKHQVKAHDVNHQSESDNG